MNVFDDEKIQHPAFGNLQISRVTGHVNLYDSPLQHQHFIALRISKAAYRNDGHRTWHTSDGEIVEVYMSAAQFAEAITSLNTAGTPCTLSRYSDPVTGALLTPRLPSPADAAIVKNEGEIRKACQYLVDASQAAIAQLDAALANKTVKKRDLKLLHDNLADLSQSVLENIPYIHTAFTEANEREVQRAKTEIVALADQVVHSRGLATLGIADGAQLVGESNAHLLTSDAEDG